MKKPLVLTLMAVFLVSGLFALGYFSKQRELPKFLVLGTEKITLELAVSEEAKARGLSGRESLSEDEGMLFVFEAPGKHGFWMQNMNFPIDILWLDSKYRVVDLLENIPPESYPQVFAPRTPAIYVLELKAGMVAKHKISLGSALVLE